MNQNCDCNGLHRDLLNYARNEMADSDTLLKMADMFKVMADPTRLALINALMVSELCVCDISAVMNMSKPAISHHLKILRQSRLVKFRKMGKLVFYSLCDKHVEMLFDQCKVHAREI